MERILVVDDEDKIRAIIRKYGEFEGYEIVRHMTEWKQLKSAGKKILI